MRNIASHYTDYTLVLIEPNKNVFFFYNRTNILKIQVLHIIHLTLLYILKTWISRISFID